MKLLIELPSWIGDAVMTTPAVENIISSNPTAEIYLIGPADSVSLFNYHPKVKKTFITEKTVISMLRTINFLVEFDMFFSFRGSLRDKITKKLVRAKKKFQFDKAKYTKLHQVEKYNCFVNESLNIKSLPNKLILHCDQNNTLVKNKLLGINPGASYGSAKRWNPKNFAVVASHLSKKFDIIIFGGLSEKKFAADIEKNLVNNNVNNYRNLAGKTSLEELMSLISNLDMFITGDSGPMHIAAAFGIPTISIFGPTNDKETSQWMNSKSKIIKKNLNCQPCMKRKCPLGHHDCMKLIEASEVLSAAEELI